MMLMVGASLFPPYPTMKLSGRMGHPASLVGLRLFAETGEDFEIGAGSVRDLLWVTFVDCGEID